MSFYLPQTPGEWLPLIAPLAAILAGLCHFLFPALSMRWAGLAGDEKHPEAIGEARSSFAGFPLGLGLSAFLFGQPLLNALVAIGFLVAALGAVLQIAVDGSRNGRSFLLLALWLALGGFGMLQSETPGPDWLVPSSANDWYVAIIALVTVIFGLIALLLPATALSMLRLAEIGGRPGARGETRGLMAGMYLAAGAGALVWPGVFVHLALGACWLVTAFGRMISMLSDRTNNGFNWLSLAMEIVLAAVPLAVVFGFV